MPTKFFHSRYVWPLVLLIWLAAGLSGRAAAQEQPQQVVKKIPSSDYGLSAARPERNATAKRTVRRASEEVRRVMHARSIPIVLGAYVKYRVKRATSKARL